MDMLSQVVTFIQKHPNVAAVFALYWVFMAAVSGMPEPTSTSGTAYVWAYRSLHALSANLDRFGPSATKGKS